jgi:SAM-dependent methyltransferase
VAVDAGTERANEPDQALRGRLHGMWAAVAPGWATHAEYADARGAGLAERMLELTGPAPGERVLELACGPGGLGIAAARRVGASGEVVLSDVVPEMTALAAERSSARGLTNVCSRELDLEDIAQPDAGFDLVLCREGLMFATDPGRALSEIRRVLRPAGRLGVAVWGPRERNPWLGVVFDAVSVQLGRAVPPPGIPGPFSLSDAGELEALLREAGFADVALGEYPVPLEAASFDEWWTRTSALAGPLAGVLATLPDDAVQAVTGRLRHATAAYVTPTGLRFPGLSLVATATRPPRG